MRTTATLDKCKLFADILIHRAMNTVLTNETIDDTLIRTKINKVELLTLIQY